MDQTNLKWQAFNGSLPNGAVSIYNDYVGRTDYVAKYKTSAGFYNPDMGPYCYYPYGDKEHQGSPFEILVNKGNLEILEWKDGSWGSVPENSVYASPNDVYVGKNQYGLGKVVPKHQAFFLPWKGAETWYKTYQVLTFNRDVISENIYDVKYKTGGVKITAYPPETMHISTITNSECRPVTQTNTLSKANQVLQKWDTSTSKTIGIKVSITAGIPIIGQTGIDINAAMTFQSTTGTTLTETTTHTVSVQHTVPPNSSCSVRMVGYKYGADIPFTAQLSRTYRNGETRSTSITGTYSSVQMGEVRAMVDRSEPIPNAKPCPVQKTGRGAKR